MIPCFDFQTCQKEINDARQDQCSKYNKRGRTYMPFEPESGKLQICDKLFVKKYPDLVCCWQCSFEKSSTWGKRKKRGSRGHHTSPSMLTLCFNLTCIDETSVYKKRFVYLLLIFREGEMLTELSNSRRGYSAVWRASDCRWYFL